MCCVRADPVGCGVDIAEGLGAIGRGAADLHGQPCVKGRPGDPRRDQAPALEGLPPMEAPPRHRPPDLPVADAPCSTQ